MPGTVSLAVEGNTVHFIKYMSKMHTFLGGQKCYGEEKNQKREVGLLG